MAIAPDAEPAPGRPRRGTSTSIAIGPMTGMIQAPMRQVTFFCFGRSLRRMRSVAQAGSATATAIIQKIGSATMFAAEYTDFSPRSARPRPATPCQDGTFA